MHPYIAYLILNNPANLHQRPDECCLGLRDWWAMRWERARSYVQGPR